MTDITLEQRAANALMSARSQIGARRPDDADDAAWWDELTELAEALRLSAGADWVLVPREPTEDMRRVLYQTLTDCHSVDESYADLLAAAPRHEPGEVDRG